MLIKKSILREMIRESVTAILRESLGSKAQHKARRFLDDRELYDTILDTFPLLRYKKMQKMTYAIAQWFMKSEYCATQNDIDTANRILEYLMDSGEIDKIDNHTVETPYSMASFIKEYRSEAEKHFDDKQIADHYAIDNHNRYVVKKLDTFQKAQSFGRYTPWCVCHDENRFNGFDGNEGMIYVLYRPDITAAPEYRTYDDFNKSMICVTFRKPNEISPYWSARCTLRDNKHCISVEECSRTVGFNILNLVNQNGGRDEW